MSKLYLFLTLLGLVNVAILVVGIHIVSEFKNFKEISDIYKKIYDLNQKLYKSILAEIKSIEDIYNDHKCIMDMIATHYDQITEQYKKIGEITEGYRKLCKECVDRYGDAYEQFKLCNDKLNKICTPKELLKDDFFYEIAPTDDTPIGGFHDA